LDGGRSRDADDGTRYRILFIGGADLYDHYPLLSELGGVRVIVLGVCGTNLSALRQALVADPDDEDWVLLFTSDTNQEFYGFSATPGNPLTYQPEACTPQLYDWCPGTTFGCAPFDFTIETPFAEPVTLRQGDFAETDDGYRISCPIGRGPRCRRLTACALSFGSSCFSPA
jgi:hypothetical protein